jgi:hypothetical protein
MKNKNLRVEGPDGVGVEPTKLHSEAVNNPLAVLMLGLIVIISLVQVDSDKNDFRLTPLRFQRFSNNFKRLLDTFISDFRAFFDFRVVGILIESKDVERVFRCNGY